MYVLDKPQKVGNNFLLKTFGGSEKRVIDLSKNELRIFKGSDKMPKAPEDVSLMSRWFFGKPGTLKNL